jgi:hypothetical protein
VALTLRAQFAGLAGVLAEPMVMALAAPLPLTVPMHIEPTTADSGKACAERINARGAGRTKNEATKQLADDVLGEGTVVGEA